MKKIFIFELIFFLHINLFCTEITRNELIGKKNQFEINETYYFIEFLNESEFTFHYPYGGYSGKNLKYTLENNKLTLISENGKPFYDDTMNKLLFPTGNTTILYYEENSDDFWCKELFKNEKICLRNFKNQTEVGKECYIDRIKVIKHSGKEFVLAKENLRLREKPDLQASTGGFNYQSYFGTAESFRTGRYTYKGYKVNSFTDYPLLLKGMTVQYEAVTVNQQTIDGIKAPWYRIILKDNSEEGAWPQRFWVFGGYLSEIENPKNPEYEEQLIQSAIEKGILEKE
jgi:hypothetical protein